MSRPQRIVLVLLAAAGLMAVGALWIERSSPESAMNRLLRPPTSSGAGDEEAAELAKVAIGGPFTLVNATGRTVTQQDYRGRWLLIYFGYTTCPDVCPTTLQTMSTALNTLGSPAALITPLFITVDPARDTPAVMGRYTTLFDKRIVGLSGTQQQISSVERTFRVYAARVDQPGSKTYLMDHTSLIYLIDPSGKLRALFGSDVTAASMAARMKAAMA
jgi:cytochrome oxidase Cu insertion factor (SCO1/SenC/PrrC family)